MSQITLMVYLQFFLCSLLFASGTKAQKMKDIHVTVSWSDASIDEVFNSLNEKTGFNFLFNDNKIRKIDGISLRAENESLEKVLKYLSLEKELQFRRVNNTISVKKLEKKPLFERARITEAILIDVTGRITDENGEPLPGATVLEKGTSNGTTTDIEGNYSLNIDEEGVLLISFVGYVSQEVRVGSQSTINVQLQPDFTSLDEIVVVGYGTQKKANLTGAVSTVTSETIDARPITSAASALQGTTSGVFINQNSGQPGRDDVLIRVRGVGTLNNANPLILVDGIEAPLNNINPDDIESITVLKDAASASIYGSRGSNGVVLVTTKRGKSTEGVSFNYNGYYGTSEAIRVPEMVTDADLLAELWNEGLTNFGSQPRFTPDQIDDFRQNGPDTDFLSELFTPAPIQQHNFSVSGASNSTNFRLSFGVLDQDGVVPKADFKRFNTRLNLDTEVNDRFTIGTSISLTRGDRNSHREDITAGGDGSLIANATRSLPFDVIRNDEGFLVLPQYGFNNVFINAAQGNFNRISNEILGSFYAEYEIIDGLKLKATSAINQRDIFDETFNQTIRTYDPTQDAVVTGPNSSRSRSRTTSKSQNLTTWLQASYERTFGSHEVKGLLGFNQETAKWDEFSASRNTFISNEIRILSVGDPSTAANNESATEWALQSYFGRVNYNFEGRYLFEANLRVDGSSRFQNDKWGNFPSFSAGWILTEESFFQVPVLDFLKIRASWGKLGNQNIGDFRYARELNLSQNYSFSGSIVQGTAQTSLGNPDLVWESSTTTDVGVNIGLFESKINIEADYFKRLTENILYDIPVPAISGFGSQIANSASVENIGWELSINYQEDLGPINLKIGGNVTHVESEVLVLNKTLGEDEVDRTISGREILEPGAPVNAYFGYRALGIFRSQAEFDQAADHTGISPNYGVGDIWLDDVNEDGVIDQDDRVVMGKQNPTWLYGGNLSVSFKGIELFAIIQGAADFQSYSGSEISQPFSNSHQLHSRWLDRWTPENPDGSLPRLYFSTGPSQASTNSFWLLDRSYFRLKNVQLSYSLPQSILGNTFIDRLKVYVNAQNLLTVTDFPYFDPERPGNTERGGQGFPNLRIYSVGLNINF